MKNPKLYCLALRLILQPSFRPGTRFASKAMRSESFGIETYSPYQDGDLEDFAIFDSGDLNCLSEIRNVFLIKLKSIPLKF